MPAVPISPFIALGALLVWYTAEMYVARGNARIPTGLSAEVVKSFSFPLAWIPLIEASPDTSAPCLLFGWPKQRSYVCI